MPEGKTSSLTAVLLLIPTVELTCYAGRSSSMPRSLTICPEVDSGRSWRLCVDCTSFVSSRRAELGETRRARPIFAPLLLRVSSPPLVSHPTALLTQSPRVAAPRRRSRECHARLPKFPSLAVPVRLAQIEDGCEDSLEEKRDGLYSTETWLCACIIENERLRRCRLLHHKRGA